MRLQKTLDEAAEFEIVVNDIQSSMHELYRILKKNSFNMTDISLEKTLDSIFKNKGIGFTKGPTKGPHVSSVISSAGITDELFVVVEYVPGFSKYFKRFAKEGKYENFFSITKNDFFRVLAQLVSHEYRHYFQGISSKMKSFKTGSDPSKIGFKDYYKSPHEIDAFALQAAIQSIAKNDSDVISQYYYYFSEADPKIWKKFLKKTRSFVSDLKKRGMEKYIKIK